MVKTMVVEMEKKSYHGIKLSITTGKVRGNLINSAPIKEFADCFHNGKFLYSSFFTMLFQTLMQFLFFENL